MLNFHQVVLLSICQLFLAIEAHGKISELLGHESIDALPVKLAPWSEILCHGVE